jgi:hypothetical protein
LPAVTAARPLVTILTPTYHKHRAFISDCTRSVIAQTYSNWELVVREDGPADPGTLAGLDDERIRYTGQESRGIWRLGETYNDLLASASGDLVAILEGDDTWPPDKLERQVAIHLRHPDIVLSFGRALRVDARGREISVWSADDLPFDQPFAGGEHLLFGCPIPAVTVVAARDALESIGGFRQPSGFPAVDYATWLALAARGPLYSSRHILGHWRVHGCNASSEHVLALARGARQLALASVRDERLMRDVERYWTEVEGDVLAAIGREALSLRDWPSARSAFAGSLRRRALSLPQRPGGAAKALVGLALSTLHIPLSRAELHPRVFAGGARG